jgi:hypothetical protein
MIIPKERLINQNRASGPFSKGLNGTVAVKES